MTRPPERVTLGDAVRALGGIVTQPEMCAKFTGQDDCCVHTVDCGLRPVWSTVNTHVQKILDGMPLNLLLQGENKITSRLDETVASLNRSLVPLQISAEV